MWCSTISQTYLLPKPFTQILRPQSPIVFTVLGIETESSLNVDLINSFSNNNDELIQNNKK